MKIPFHKPISPNSVDSILNDSLSSGWITTGPKVKKFEDRLRDVLKCENVIALNSCTAALHLALVSKGLNHGEKFITSTYTFVASVEVGEYMGAEPVLVDCDIDTFNMDLNQVENSLKKNGNKIKAIIPVHFGGQAVDMDSLFKLADKYGIFVLEDAAHALETISNSGKVGNTNHASAFSFYANKNITTGGEGGALATNDSKLAENVRILSLHGMSKDGWKRFATNENWQYDVQELGYKYNMTDITASFGIEQLTHVDAWHRRRLEIVDQYSEGFKPIKGIIIPKHVSGKLHAWHLYVIRILPDRWKINRNKLINKLIDSGIGTAVHYIPIHMHSYYERKYGYKPYDFPVAKQLSDTVITLPLYPRLTNNEVEYIITTLNELWNKYQC
jgi:dTDP-4-amino-4,6-dideoxygalactose transaminase